MLHERVLGPFRADLVCESTGFRCSSGSRERERHEDLAIAIERASICLAFKTSSLRVHSHFSILQGREDRRRVSTAGLRGSPQSFQAQTFGGAKATLLNVDQGMFIQEVFSIAASLLLVENLFDVVPVACSECHNEPLPPDE